MNTKKSLIYIIEDDIPCGKLILYFLKTYGFKNVVLFTTGEECLKAMARKPRILITDYRLKSMNGLQLVSSAKKVYADFYCILLSGMNYEEFSSLELTKRYVDKYIMKGIKGMDDLLLTLNEWIYTQCVEQYG